MEHFVILDPGHGDRQLGKRSCAFYHEGRKVQFLEYEFNYDVAHRIAAILRSLGIGVEFTYESYKGVASFIRQRQVRQLYLWKAHPGALFISIHSNAAPLAQGQCWQPFAQGVEVYHYNQQSIPLATLMLDKIVEHTGMKKRRVATANYGVLVKYPGVAILTESGFYTHPEEVVKLLSDSMRQRIAQAHCDAIMEYYKRVV
ncbi:MAG: hypothetical protein KatS3mg054_0017 [Chloroflexus sp.]|nr:MAG: hypothetical protein KatS3mg054_0017 [Chloroflexus sp.]